MTCLLLLLFLCAHAVASAQTLEVKISVSSLSPPRIRVEGDRAAATKAWSFLNIYAGVMGLGERIENLSVSDAGGKAVPIRLLAPGEYEAESEARRFSYDIKLDPPARATDAAHVSWLTDERGLLLLADLLPRPLDRAKVSLIVPQGWSIISSEGTATARQFEIAEAEHGVFLIGRDLRNQNARKGAMETAFVTTGTWAFSDDDLARTGSEIIKDYEKMMGGVPRRRANIFVLPFPRAISAQNWSAETRGGNVIVLSGQWPSKTIALSRLDNLLSHELLHLWVPNGLSLDGEYGWFYEGFTLYQSLRAGLRRGQLTFQDYLNAIARANDNYKAAKGSQSISMIEASRRRWNVAPSLIYDQGMLIAFLYDLTLMRNTSGKSSLDDAYRAVFRQYGSGAAREEGSHAITKTLKSFEKMERLVSRYIESAAGFDLSSEIGVFGLRLEKGAGRTQIAVNTSLTKAQNDLLRELGYNNKDNSTSRKLHERLRKNLR